MQCACGVSFDAYSGNPPYRNNSGATSVPKQGPIPEGTYYNVDRPMGRAESFWNVFGAARRSDWFGLYRDDAMIDDATVIDGIVRNRFRLHAEGPARSSEGCVTVVNSDAYTRLRELLLATQKGVIPGTQIPYYGTVTVYRPAFF